MPAMRRALALALAFGCVAAVSPVSPVEAHRGLLPTAVLAEDALAPVPAPTAIVAPAALPPVPTPTVTPVSAERVPPTPGIPTSGLALAAALGAAAVAVRRRPRLAIAASLVVLLAVFVFESGVHSVHHLGETGRSAACHVAATSEHLSGTETDGVVVGYVPGPPRVAVLGWSLSVVPLQAPSPHEGRAPPVSA
jgi:hypothetical protein